jgi:oligopeptide/dipeptide ABC transporter ATP-binding protein
LFGSLPRVDRHDDRLQAIAGNVPPPTHFPAGCRFRDRCAYSTEKCREWPPLMTSDPNHQAACWFAEEIAAGRREPHAVAAASG